MSEPIETVDAELVPASEPRAIEPVRRSPVAVQAAVAVGGFAAGVVTVAAVRHHRVQRAARRRPKGVAGKVLASRSFLVDVHLLGQG